MQCFAGLQLSGLIDRHADAFRNLPVGIKPYRVVAGAAGVAARVAPDTAATADADREVAPGDPGRSPQAGARTDDGPGVYALEPMDICPASAAEQPADGTGIDSAIPRHSRVVDLPDAWHQLDCIDLAGEYRTRVHTLRTVPHCIRGAYSRIQSSALGAISRAYSSREPQAEHARERAWKLFLLLPRMLLHRVGRGGDAGKRLLQQRVRTFDSGGWGIFCKPVTRASSEMPAVPGGRTPRKAGFELLPLWSSRENSATPPEFYAQAVWHRATPTPCVPFGIPKTGRPSYSERCPRRQ
jgi:hypothetical protein